VPAGTVTTGVVSVTFTNPSLESATDEPSIRTMNMAFGDPPAGTVTCVSLSVMLLASVVNAAPGEGRYWTVTGPVAAPVRRQDTVVADPPFTR
jgi:hypothetical protein